jgi:molybdopterin molybdotransferase
MPGAGPFFDVRMRGFQHRCTVEHLHALIDEHVALMPARSMVVRAGLCLAEAVVAQRPVPGFARSAMDGYAIRAEESFGASAHNPLPFRIVGHSRPGAGVAVVVQPGTAVSIMTGAPLPTGADAVLPAEVAELQGAVVLARDAVTPGRHVAHVEEDLAVGQAVLAAGRVLRPQDVGVLSALGISQVLAVPVPRVAVIITGDELLPAFAAAVGYRIPDANSPMLRGLVERDGGVCLEPWPVHCEDNFDTLKQTLATIDADLILIAGGSSVGQEDHAPRAVAELGQLLAHGVALRPASPTGFGVVQGRPVFLLPGNPVSCLCGYDLFARRALRHLAGQCLAWPYRVVERTLASKVVSAVGRVDYVRLQEAADNAVSPLAVSGASRLSSAVLACGFHLVLAECEGYPAGATIPVLHYD